MNVFFHFCFSSRNIPACICISIPEFRWTLPCRLQRYRSETHGMLDQQERDGVPNCSETCRKGKVRDSSPILRRQQEEGTRHDQDLQGCRFGPKISWFLGMRKGALIIRTKILAKPIPSSQFSTLEIANYVCGFR